MGILPILNTSPCWAVPKEVPETECETNYPVSDAEYAEFAAHIAVRYVEYFTNGEIDPVRCPTLYKAAVIAGRNANPATRYRRRGTAPRLELVFRCGGTVRRHAHGGTRWSLDDLHESDGLFGLGLWLPHVPRQGHQCRGDRGESRDLLLVSDSGRGVARIKN